MYLGYMRAQQDGPKVAMADCSGGKCEIGVDAILVEAGRELLVGG